MTISDLTALHDIAERATAKLQTPFLDADQIGASARIMGIDTQIIRDGTYFAVESNRMIVRVAEPGSRRASFSHEITQISLGPRFHKSRY